MNVDMPIGIVGLGNMGLEIAGRISVEFPIIGTDLSSRQCDKAQDSGIAIADSLAQLVEKCETVILSLPNLEASASVVQAIAAHPGIVRTVLETSTVTPQALLNEKAELAGTDVELLDAAILAGVAQMKNGTAGMLLAGDGDRIASIEALLDAITPNRRVLGESGAAMAAKVINNAVAHSVMVLLTEAVSLSVKGNLDPKVIIDILSDPTGGLMRPLTHRIAERVAGDEYEGGMSLEAARKDSMLAIQMGMDYKLPIPTISCTHSIYEMALSRGWGDQDYAVLAKLWEDWGGKKLMVSSI